MFQNLPEVVSIWKQKGEEALAVRLDQNLPCLSCQPVAPEVRALAYRFRDRFSTVLVLGTGGSSLGGQVLCSLTQEAKESNPRLIFLDDIHPEAFYPTVLAQDPARTAVIVISKSGKTIEPLCQLLAIFEHFLPPQHAEHFCILTESHPSPLRALVETYKFSHVEVPADIGGRFSVLSVTGLFPALISGLDENLLLKGACTMLTRLRERDPELLHALAVAAEGACTGRQNVFLTYDARLTPLALWYRQLWAESVGKEGRGTLPILAQGTVDQHSQFQLYLDGPDDKIFTALAIKQTDTHALFCPPLQESVFKALEGKTMGQLLETEFQAACDTLRAQKIPVRQSLLPVFDASSLGRLLTYFICETIVVADLLSVDPFNQPAVEQLKKRTQEILTQ
jgi:glucose-6-phosphate isomerase